jgi:hypothetical protein
MSLFIEFKTEAAVWFETAFLPEHNVLAIQVHGTGEADLVPQMVAAIQSAPEFRPGMSVLIDALGTDYLPTPQEADTFAAFFQTQLPGSRMAVFVRGGAQYSVSRHVETIAGQLGMPFAVFRDRGEAMEWLTASS